MKDMAVTPLIEVRDLQKLFPIKSGFLGRAGGHVRAVDGISFDIHPGETLGLVGESGSGKTTVSRMLLRLLDTTAGRITFDGRDVTAITGHELRALRRDMQIVFQDPFGSLNPRMTARRIIAEPMIVDGTMDKMARDTRINEMLERVGLPISMANRYPHQFSGGQRQRIGIARALAMTPRFLVCDEAVSALDLSIQAQIVNLLRDLQKELGLTTLFVAHDLQVVRYISDRVAVMYLGRIVELAPTDTLYARPAHPYTQKLLGAAPRLGSRRNCDRAAKVSVEMPNPISPPPGCHFHPRCPLATDLCRREAPVLRTIAGRGEVACHHADRL